MVIRRAADFGRRGFQLGQVQTRRRPRKAVYLPPRLRLQRLDFFPVASFGSRRNAWFNCASAAAVPRQPHR